MATILTPGGRARYPGLKAFACALYARPGVAAACLRLQDRHGVDVPLLLALVWHGASGRGVPGRACAGAWRRSVRRWRRIVEPLRASRDAIKPLAARDAAALRLRKAILAAELDAEFLLLRDLERDAGAVRVRDAALRYEHAHAATALAGRDLPPRALTQIFSGLGRDSQYQAPDRRRTG